MRLIIMLCTLLTSLTANADTINHYVDIANRIPQMEMKADPQAQMWARSARNVLSITSETLAETLQQANDMAARNGRPLFCLPQGIKLTSDNMNSLILQTYRELSSQESDKNKLTVSQIAMMGVTKTYPCDKNAGSMRKETALMQHINAMNQH